VIQRENSSVNLLVRSFWISHFILKNNMMQE